MYDMLFDLDVAHMTLYDLKSTTKEKIIVCSLNVVSLDLFQFKRISEDFII